MLIGGAMFSFWAEGKKSVYLRKETQEHRGHLETQKQPY